ncbi:MAG: TssN family type VI secretion system protein [Candidatus Symbiothrix sp.]|nr:TssN family type VI secretion system protein [Candidatus Symbiothrix sp.]
MTETNERRGLRVKQRHFACSRETTMTDSPDPVVRLLLEAFALGFWSYSFFSTGYVWLVLVYLCFGFVIMNVITKISPLEAGKAYWIELLTLFVFLFVGAALFSVVFNVCSELKYGVWASTCLMGGLLPSLFLKSYHSYLEIPPEIHSIWSYDAEKDDMEAEKLESDKIIVVELELFKQASDTELLTIKAKAAENTPFGIWFKLFMKHYNIRSPLQPIAYEANGQSFGWIFYTQPVWGGKKYIDPAQSFAQNKIKEKNLIFAKRVHQQKTENNIK